MVAIAYVASVLCVSAQEVGERAKYQEQGIFDSSGDSYYRLDSIYIYTGNNSSWNLDSKDEYSYIGQEINDIKTFDFNGGTWSNLSMTTFSNIDQSTWEKEKSEWDQVGSTWKKTWKKRYENSADNGYLDINYSEWANNNSWVNNWKQIQEYSSSGALLSYETTRWNSISNQWESYWKYECMYDGNDNLLQVNNQSYNKETSAWEDELEYIHEYLSNNVKTEMIIDWDAQAQEWNNVRRATIDDSEANTSLVINEVWNSASDSWVKKNCQTKRFSTNGDLIEIQYEIWDTGLNNWEASRIDRFSYNEDGLKTEESISYYDSQSETWKNYLKMAYHYTLDVSNDVDDDKPINKLVVYPSPADSEIYLNFSGEARQLIIYSIDGKVVLGRDRPKAGRPINVNVLRPGVYIAVVMLETGQAQVKFMKK